MTKFRPVAALCAVLAGAALALAGAAPAQAADPTIDSNGIVTIGGAHWKFDQYGLAYGWDAGDYYDPSGYIYYPNEFYTDDYVYCGLGGPPDDGTVTVESNGDLTIVCPEGPWGSSGLTAFLTFRVYQGTDSGYLVRQLVTITNPTAGPIDISGDHFVYNYDGHTGTQGTPGFETSLASDTVQADDTWFVSSMTDGSSVVETEAWAVSGSAPGAGIIGDNYPGFRFDPANSTYAPGETKYFVTFTNMVIPQVADSQGATNAINTALAQTEEFSSFSGRLVTGLPASITVIGWGTTPAAPALASTGSDVKGTIVLIGSSAAILALAGGLLVASARRRASQP